MGLRCGLLSLWLLASPALGLQPPVPGPELESSSRIEWNAFHTFGTTDGLPQNSIIALMQDDNGLVYAGTFEGFARYDGQSWRSVELPTEGRRFAVGTLAQAVDRSIWVGTDSEGLWRGVGDEFARVVLSADGAINTLLATDDEQVWVGSSSGLSRCLADSCESIAALAGVGVRSLLREDVDGEPVLWVGTNGQGVWQLHDLATTPRVSSQAISRGDGLPNSVGLSLRRFGGDLWIGTGRGLARLRDDHLITYGEANGFPVAMVFGLQPVVDPDGKERLYASLRPGGLARIDVEGNWSLIDGEHGLPSHAAHALLLERYRGLLWIGTMTAGIARLEHERWALFDERSGLPDRLALSVGLAEDTDSIWVGTARGAVTWREGRFRPLLPPPHSELLVYDVMDAPDGTRWIAHSQGVQHWRGGALIHDFNVDNSELPAVSGDRLALRHLPSGAYEIFVGSGHGLAVWREGDGLRRVRDLPDDFVEGPIRGFATLRTDDPPIPDALWVVGGMGIVREEEGEWSRLSEVCLRDRATFGMDVELGDKGLNFWVATRDGLIRIDAAGSCRTWHAADQLGTLNHVRLVGEHVYVFGNRGVLKLDRSGPPDQVGVLFGAESGLSSTELTASAVDAWGRVFAASASGLAALSPEPGKLPRSAAPLRLLSAVYGGSGLALRAGMRLPSEEASIDVHYALLAFDRESQARYRTRMVGLEHAPGPWLASPQTRFERLPPGEFELVVEARDADGVEAEPIRLRFAVAPPWWRTPWALFGGSAMLVALGLSLGRWRLLAARRRAEELESEVAERTRELAAANVRLEEASVTDPLTGLRNRRFFALTAQAEADRARRTAPQRGMLVSLMDIDHFKLINDNHGHDIGDAVLVEVARRLQTVARAGDFVLRWGGEEFLLLFRDVPPEEADILLRRLLFALSGTPFEIGELTLTVSASIGALFYPPSTASHAASSIERAVTLADEALYRAKHAGRARAIRVEPAQAVDGWRDISIEVDAVAAGFAAERL